MFMFISFYVSCTLRLFDLIPLYFRCCFLWLNYLLKYNIKQLCEDFYLFIVTYGFCKLGKS